MNFPEDHVHSRLLRLKFSSALLHNLGLITEENALYKSNFSVNLTVHSSSGRVVIDNGVCSTSTVVKVGLPDEKLLLFTKRVPKSVFFTEYFVLFS